ncbi:MAG TPA: hypothetical protein VKZ65_06255, partial [Glycomyces sp.]|nr:hypothetical protein [Glycomyces sp.]
YWWERIGLFLAALLLLSADLLTDVIGIALAAALVAIQYLRRNRGQADPDESAQPEVVASVD